MKLPILSYNLRNLVVRKTTTIMTALGIALTVAVLVADLALVNGLRTAFRGLGQPSSHPCASERIRTRKSPAASCVRFTRT